MWSPINQEPIVKEANLQDNIPALRADLAVHEVWGPQTEVLFDSCVIDTDAQSYVNRSPMEVLGVAEKEIKTVQRYGTLLRSCRQVSGAFIYSVN